MRIAAYGQADLGGYFGGVTADGAKSSPASGSAIGLVFRLARRSVWLLGVACMIAGFVLQLAALHFGALALVQPSAIAATASDRTAARPIWSRPSSGTRRLRR